MTSPPRAIVPAVSGMEIVPLTRGASDFATLTFPRLAPMLDTVAPPWVAAGIRVGGLPAGLALGLVREGDARLLSVSVARPLRRRGVGSALVTAWEAQAAALGATVSRAGHTGRLPGRRAFEATLARAGWAPTRPMEIWAIGETGPMVAEVGRWPSVAGRVREPNGFTFEPWREPDADDGAAISAGEAEPDFLPSMAPALCAGRVEPACSIAVRRDGALVGWVLGERAEGVALDGYRDRPAIYYRSAYLSRPLWHTGLLVGAYWHAYARQAEAFGPRSIATFRTAMPRMMALVRRRFAPISLRIDETFETTKPLFPHLQEGLLS